MRESKKSMLVDKNTGEVMERFRLKSTALSMIYYYERIYGRKLKVVDDEANNNKNKNK